MEAIYKPGILFRFRRPSSIAKRTPSKAMTEVLRHLAESEEMRPFIADARAQRRNVVVEVFHSRDGHPLLIHIAAASGRQAKKVPMPEREKYWLFEVRQKDGEFLRQAGVKPCLLDDPCPRPLPQSFPGEPHVRLTEQDAQLLKACGVTWKREPAVQLSLDFRGRQETVQES